MTFNGTQLAAIVKLAQIMAASDGIVKPEELAVIARELIKFNVKEKDVPSILAMANSLDATIAMALTSSMTQDQKKYVCAYLGVVMASDGDIDDAEMKVWGLISHVCNFPKMSLSEAIAIL